jgi:cystathionine beta-lyase/cystathionine gamma-synthase
MAAIATTLVTLLQGDRRRVVAARQVYGDTRDLLLRDLPALGLDVTMVDAVDLDAWAEAIDAAPTAVVYAESLSNPQLDLTDLAALAELAHRAGAKLVVDSTFATPYTINPLSVGADVVVHSAAKFLSGHSDVIAGVVVGDRATVTEVQRRMITFGGCLDPHAAFLVWRGLQTFDVRLERASATALALAERLSEHPEVVSVRYPGLPGYAWRETAEKLMRPGRGGAMMAFTVRGGDRRALAVMRRLVVASEAPSLGGVETLVCAPFISSHFSLSEQELAANRIDPGMLRLSCGLEDAEALIADLEGALDATVEP